MHINRRCIFDEICIKFNPQKYELTFRI